MSNGYQENLIYDVGMHVGQDSAYYLSKGFDVIAIEANPELVDRAANEFRAALDAKKLRILNFGITAEPGEFDFHISNVNDVWSSFNKANADQGGGNSKTIRVTGVRFRNILQKYGVPFYLKIDIEGSDHLCIDDLQSECLPRYVSVELSHTKGGWMIDRLFSLGFTGFKFVRQNDLSVIAPDELPAYLKSRRRTAGLGLAGHVIRRARNIWKRAHPLEIDGWVFPHGSSGPFGQDLAGRWSSAAEATQIWRALTEADKTLSGAALGDWFDIHAAR